ncbi:MAG: T9SS type A sorting domain-containing protein [Tannerellaceae bacterium]|jgi:hypothetical protein|nr:T9SS type A sorting domain-containing protein [Tannerellaceae bacterium]
MKKHQLIVVFFFFFLASLVQAQVLYNTGGMYVGGAASENGQPALYIQGDVKAGGDSRIAHKGKTVLTGNFINDVTSGNVFSSWDGIFEFKGKVSQQIKGTADRSSHYIKFPDQVIINMLTDDYLQSTIVIDTCMGISIRNLKFRKGRMVVDSKAVPNSNRTQVAHLWVEPNGIILYNHLATAASSEHGFVQVNLDLGDNHTRGGLVGFSSPYKTLYADYFFYNFLAVPKTSNLFSGARDGLWIKYPLTPLNPGAGYILGQALVPHYNSGYYNSMLDSQWKGAKFSDVVTEKYSFGRMLAPESFTQFNKNADRYTGEELNVSNVTVPITEGYNYLGNPFTVPLDLSSYLDNPQTSDFGNFNPGEMKNTVYLLSGGKTEYTGGEFSFTATYQTISKVGGTYEGGNQLIAPMQMFVVKKETSTPANFTIPLSKRSHGETSLLRSARQEVVDELLIETKDNITGGYDRLCIVFRNDATLKANHPYDAEKLFNKTGGVNQIYTRSSNNKELITNVVKPDTKKMTMYLVPPNERQEITLKAKRLNSLKSITSIIIEDHKTGRLVDLMKTSFTFLSSPSDKVDRFTLHFNSSLVSIDDIKTTSSLSAYYSFGQVTVQGLTEKALNKEVMIYNMQGQLMHKQIVTAIEPLLIRKFLDKGVYIVNIAEEPQAIKLWVK